MSAGNGKGVRIEFDDENDNMGSGTAATGERQMIDRQIGSRAVIKRASLSS